ncbi:hypothetical protein [Actinomadura algeriensis]|uniref:MFS family permease n=1 Tax=Actinomadura algeriensis TaxID=1679523 RepID=A0ABR9JIA7_9ACTN|nr:hypothetical protein [Actinomadura algeriensis]MBE1530262.1 MFS family permease [Actinomadura algeriensis]
MPGDVSPSREAVSIRIGSLRTRMLATTGAAFVVLGVYTVFYAAVEMEGERATSILFGIACALLGLAALPLWWWVIWPRKLVIDAAGLHRVDPRGIPWTVEWRELERVTFAFPQVADKSKGPVPVLRIELRPADETFEDDHPEMERWEDSPPDEPGAVYRMPLGRNRKWIEPIDGALSAFAPGVYRPERRPVPEGRGRPVKVAASVVFLAVAWVVAMMYGALQTGDLGGAAIAVVWLLAIGAWLVRVWAGGATAIGFLITACTSLGGVLLGGAVLMAFVLGTDSDGWDGVLRPIGSMVLAGFALLVPGRLLARPDVREWSAERAES